MPINSDCPQCLTMLNRSKALPKARQPRNHGQPQQSRTVLLLLVLGAVVLLGAGKQEEEPAIENVSCNIEQKHEGLSNQQQLQVHEAIKLGKAFLHSKQEADGSWKAGNDTLPGHTAAITALVGLTLLECEVGKGDPAVKKAADFLRKLEAAKKISQTYDVSLTLLFLDRLEAKEDAALMRNLTLRLVGGQTADGGWSYNCPIFSEADDHLLLHLLEGCKGEWHADLNTHRLTLHETDKERLKKEAKGALPPSLANLTVWQKDVVMPKVTSDNSNTQFAILALWVAKSRGFPVHRTLCLLVKRYHDSQNKDGSWGYESAGGRTATAGDGGPPTSMTCAGLLGLAVGQGLVNEARGNTKKGRKPAAQQDPAIQHGLDYLGKAVGDPHKPWQNAKGAPLVNLYFLWSLERMGVIFNLDRIGGKDWYGWGAEMLIAHQTKEKDKGHWDQGLYYGQQPTINTCLALLFLRRANLAHDLTRCLEHDD